MYIGGVLKTLSKREEACPSYANDIRKIIIIKHPSVFSRRSTGEQ